MAQALRAEVKELALRIGRRAIGRILVEREPSTETVDFFLSADSLFMEEDPMCTDADREQQVTKYIDTFMELFFPQKEEKNLNKILQSYRLLLENWSNEIEVPVIIFGAPFYFQWAPRPTVIFYLHLPFLKLFARNLIILYY